MKISAFFLTIFLCFAFVGFAVGQEDEAWEVWRNGSGRWFMYHLEKSDVELLKKKWDEVGKSLENDTTEFSGNYIIPGYMSGYFFRWSKEGGYVFVRFFDVEHPCYFSYGDVEVTESTIRFDHKGKSRNSACPPPDSGRPEKEWVPALGGQYLVPRSKLTEFIDFYCGFNDFNGYLRTYEPDVPFPILKDAKPPPTFILPDAFSQFIKHPLSGEIVSVGKTRTRKPEIFVFAQELETVTPVTINVGRKHGVEPNQEFILLTDDDGASETLIVTSVARSSSRGVVVRKVIDDGKEGFLEWDQESNDFVQKPFAKLRPGINITTSPLSKIY